MLKIMLLGSILAMLPPRGPKCRKLCFWDRFWPYFRPGVQNVENHASGIDFGNASAQVSKMSKTMLLGSILAMLPHRGPKCRKSCSGIDFGCASAQGSKMSKTMLLGSILAMLPPRGPKCRKLCFWDRFWPYFRPGVQNVENHASGIDFGHASAQVSKMSKIKLKKFKILLPCIQFHAS